MINMVSNEIKARAYKYQEICNIYSVSQNEHMQQSLHFEHKAINNPNIWQNFCIAGKQYTFDIISKWQEIETAKAAHYKICNLKEAIT